MPLFWVMSEHERSVKETLRTDPLVEQIDQLTHASDRVLYAVSWSPDVDALVTILLDLEIDVMRAEGTAEFWEFRLQFMNRETLTQFRHRCADEAIELDLLGLYNPMMPAEKGPLSSEQYDVLAMAYGNGYWDVPRRITQNELAELIGISETTISKRLRTAIRRLVEKHVYGPAGEPF
ncbi:HTH DNA binding domain protein [Halalkalicoccus paucihalophilus]|uniref:HTH DNA binding domain protein n=2 Tax=Halalkalicoccus paucihalophilus TaxID=1008153 RepID=A0A151A970_9EURY|nr:HTH DNA binding domain protein [Halalkalicoccus paucihalophilus]